MDQRLLLSFVIVLSVARVHALLTSSLTNRTLNVNVGDNVRFDCRTDEHSNQFSWYVYKSEAQMIVVIFNGGRLSPTFIQRFSVTVNISSGQSTLGITDIRRDDAGNYSCLYYNTARNRLDFQLTVAEIRASTTVPGVTTGYIKSAINDRRAKRTDAINKVYSATLTDAATQAEIRASTTVPGVTTSYIKSAINDRRAKRKDASKATEYDSKLYNAWLSSEITENKAKTSLIELIKQKTLLEITKLQLEVAASAAANYTEQGSG